MEMIQRMEIDSSEYNESSLSSESLNDFLKQIVVYDSSGITKFFMVTLESMEKVLHKNKLTIDIITYERIVLEFLQRSTDLVNRFTRIGWYRLEMESRDDSN